MRRVLIACIALRTNLTVRELAALAGLPKSTLHRIVASMTPRIAAIQSSPGDRRFAWVIDGTLIPTRDHRRAAKSKNYRWSPYELVELCAGEAGERELRIDHHGIVNVRSAA